MPKLCCNAQLAHSWNSLFLTITNLKEIISAERRIDREANIAIDELPIVATNLASIATLLTDEYAKRGFDGPYIEYFLHNDLLGTMVSMAQDDIPDGLLCYVTGFCTALLSALPPAFFCQEAIFRSISKLVSLLLTNLPGNPIESGKMERQENISKASIALLDYLTRHFVHYPPLVALFKADSSGKCTALRLATKIVQNTKNTSTDAILDAAVARLLRLGMLQDDIEEGEPPELLEYLVLSLVTAFADGSFRLFLNRWIFLEECIDAAASHPTLPVHICSLFKYSFVDRIYERTLRDCIAAEAVLQGRARCEKGQEEDKLNEACKNDKGNVSSEKTNFKTGKIASTSTRFYYILDLLLAALQASHLPDLFLPLWSCTMKALSMHQECLENLSNDCRNRLFLICSHSLANPVLAQSFHPISPIHWTEAINVHRARCALFLETCAKIDLNCFKDVQSISNLYRIHLKAAETTIVDIKISPSSPLHGHSHILTDPTIHLDIAKPGTLLSQLMDKSKGVLWRAFTYPALSLWIWALHNSRPEQFYTELDASNSKALVSMIFTRLSILNGIKDTASLDWAQRHVHADPFDHRNWSPLPQEELIPSIEAYLLAHALLRLSAISQVRATRPNTTIIYD